MKWIETKSDQLSWGRRAQGSITDPRWTDQPRSLPSTHPPLNTVPRDIGKKMILVERSNNELISDVIRSWRCHQNIHGMGSSSQLEMLLWISGKTSKLKMATEVWAGWKKTNHRTTNFLKANVVFLCLLQERCFINIYEHWTLKWILHIGYLGKKH